MTLEQILQNTSLKPKEALILLSFLIKKPLAALLAHTEVTVNPNDYKRYKTLEKKRLAGWSLAVLIGQKEFYGLNFKVNQHVLIPRPETELLVDDSLKLINNKIDQEPLTIIDLGTGSGAIIITLANELQKYNLPLFKKINFLASDISATALKIARQNTKNHSLIKKITFYQGDLLAPFKNKLKDQNIIITANLPYLTARQFKNSPSIQKEPRLALISGLDGLKHYRRLFKQLGRTNYCSLTLFCEIDPGQKTKIKTLAKKYFPQSQIVIKSDLAGRARLAIIKNQRA
ncbi:MAG: peptide chain release factor N(5)-glutamine methyltransferase [Patescibacteria group bacterium]|jgi:release factor glutamine methyltransferase